MGNIPPSALRHMSPPPRCCSEGSVMGGTEDPHSSRIPARTTRNEEGNGSRVRSGPCYFRRGKCKKVNSTNIDSLPDELLSEILVRLSADDIFDNARVVCGRWYHLIRTDAFVYAHLHRTSSGLLLGQSFASMEYKVVGTYCDDWETPLVQCSILTVGVDSTWRHVSFPQLAPPADELLLRSPMITQGFMHWASTEGADVLTLNVETEILTETPVPLLPPDYQEKVHKYYYLSTERYLSVLISRGEFSWEVWEMKPESGEWRKVLPNIDLEAHKCRIQRFACKSGSYIRPVGWVRYPELLVFFIHGYGFSCFVYNLDTDELDCIKLPSLTFDYTAIVHRNSLVCLG